MIDWVERKGEREKEKKIEFQKRVRKYKKVYTNLKMSSLPEL